jgi:lipopolysaccharide export system permease protein
MKLLDRYIVRQFCINFFILLLVLFLLFIAVDLTVNLDEFLEAGRTRAAQFDSVVLGTLYSVFDYYYPLSVLLYVFFSGLVAVAAMGFTFALLHRSRELTAMLASGVSLYRVALPVIVMGIAFNALALPAREFIIPEVAGKLMRSSSDVKFGSMQGFPVRFAADEAGALLTASHFNPKTQSLHEVILRRRSDQRVTTERITAERGTWQSDRGAWLLEDVTIQRYDADALDDAQQAQPQYVYQSDLSPEVLVSRRASNYPRFMSIRKLQQLQHNQALAGDLRSQIVQALWSRFSLLVLNVLVLVMALPFFLRRQPGSMLAQAVKAAGVVMGIWGGGLVMLQMPSTLFSPVVAAWLPVVICLPVAAILLQLIRT